MASGEGIGEGSAVVLILGSSALRLGEAGQRGLLQGLLQLPLLQLAALGVLQLLQGLSAEAVDLAQGRAEALGGLRVSEAPVPGILQVLQGRFVVVERQVEPPQGIGQGARVVAP